MPVYEYLCEKCRHNFSIKVSMAEQKTRRISCPACKGKKVRPQFSIFYARTSKKS